MNTYAAVVGIEKYHPPGWDVFGPCANAIAVARWLLSIEELRANIYAFLDPMQPLGDEIGDLERRGVQVIRSATFAEIDEFFHVGLPRDRPQNSRLLVYWSGHGCTNKRGDRIFFCRDYQVKLPNRVFNGSTFLRTLRSSDHRCFADQIVLADVCGTYNRTPINDPREAPEGQRPVSQLVYFATPEGKYAQGANGRGVFTETALGVLTAIGDWPKHDTLVRDMDAAFDKVGETPFLVESFSDGNAYPERRVGKVSAEMGNPHFRSVFELLSGLDIVGPVFLPHYQRTAAAIGIPADDAQGLVGIVKELSSLRDSELTKGVPHGLLEFLMRLVQEKTLEQPISAWLDANAATQLNTLKEIRQKLAVERKRKILVIVVTMNANRNIDRFEAYLRNHDFTPVPERTAITRPVTSWPDFVTKVQELLAEFVIEGRLQNLQIHFLADPPLFDWPFHRIPLAPGGPPIGQQAVVVLRDRRRVLPSADENLQKDWNKWAAALRRKRPKKMKWVKIEADSPVLPAEKGLFFAGFVLPPVDEGGAACEREKQLLARLLDIGAPYLCVPHALPAGRSWDAVKRDLTSLLKELRNLDGFPDKFRSERLRGSELASQTSILWDDPLAKPFGELEGVGTP